MYRRELRKRADINSSINNLFSGSYPNRYTNNSLNYYDNLKKELEARKTKKGRILFRKNLLESQDKINYTNELDRIRGELSRYDTRFPILTLENLYNRALTLKKLGAKITNEQDFNEEMNRVEKEIHPRTTIFSKPSDRTTIFSKP